MQKIIPWLTYGMAAALLVLSGCVTPVAPSSGQILRLTPAAASAAAATAAQLPPQEKARYDRIDQQVLREQANRRSAVVYSSPSYTVMPAISYYGYYPAYSVGYSYGYPYGYGWYSGFSGWYPGLSFSIRGGW